jgi:hypothetical protein
MTRTGRPRGGKNKSYDGPKCERDRGAKHDHKPCRRPAGWGTAHPGEGACKLHGGVMPGDKRVKSGGYSRMLKTSSIAQRLAELTSELRGSLDLVHEVDLLRAMIVDYVERYESLSEALLAWHDTYSEFWLQAESMARRTVNSSPGEFEANLEKLKHLYYMQRESKPRKMLDITQAAVLVDRVIKAVMAMEKRKVGQIKAETMSRILSEMSAVVARNVDDPEVLAKIGAEWENIRFGD